MTPAGDILLERKAWYQIWIHQFLRAKVLRFLFSHLPAQVPSAKALDGLKNRIEKPEDYHLFVTQQNFAVFGESTKRGAITEIALESIARTDIELPEWFRRSNGERITMGQLPGDLLAKIAQPFVWSQQNEIKRYRPSRWLSHHASVIPSASEDPA